MKALALGLIRGTIDQVEQIVRITWMQGRVLDTKGMGGDEGTIRGMESRCQGVGRMGLSCWTGCMGEIGLMV